MKTLTLIALLFSVNAFAASINPIAVNAIANDIDALVADTVDEGEWDADVKRDQAHNPTDMTCKIVSSTSKSELYSCDITFKVVPYEGSDVDESPWETTCYNVRYNVKTQNLTTPKLSRIEETTDACIEALSEIP